LTQQDAYDKSAYCLLIFLLLVSICTRVLHTDELVSRTCKDFPNYHYLSRNERYAESVRKSALYLKLVREHGLDDDAKRLLRL